MANGLFTLKQQVEALRQGAWSGYIAPKWVEYLVVAGGGGGATSNGSNITGGGGAGGLLTGIVTVAAGASYTVTVGAGGAAGTNGLGSGFGSITTAGGGSATTSNPSNSGGSGGGGTTSGSNYTGGQGISGQGNAGGTTTGSTTVGSGGGGAGTVGINGVGSSTAGNGGAGIASAISGTVVTYAGGGGGGSRSDFPAGSGGVGGGGAGALGNNVTATSGGSNTGGGGGGNGQLFGVGTGGTGGSGGSGIVIVRYPGTVQFFTGGTLSYANGYIIHTFYATGTLAPTTPTVYIDTPYQISRSLRFNRSDSPYLNRTPVSTGSRTTFTLSLWLKLGNLTTGTDSVIWATGDASTGNPITLLWKTFSTNYFFNITGTSTEFSTTALFRDPSAWYHVVLAFDTTQATDTNRVKLYVNGVQVTSFTTATYPAQNFTYDINTSSYPAYIGCLAVSASRVRFWEGYQTEINFIDGQALTPSAFGYTNPATGVWGPHKFVGTYGTNGFYLKFADNSNTTAATLGADSSGNGNNWTPNNFSVTAGAGNDSLVDTPTQYGDDTGVGGSVRGNYNTMNPVNKGSTVTLTNGNLDQVTASGGWNSARGTIAVSSGKWYWEVTITGTTQSVMHGVDDNAYNVTTNPSSSYVGAYQNSWGVYTSNGDRRNNTGAGTVYGSSFAQNDVMMVALDMDTGKIWWGKNGTWFASGSPSAGTNAAYTNLSGYTLNPATSGFDTTDSCTHNFGQRAFAYTAPSGFKALCTQNLPTPTIGGSVNNLAGNYFGVNTYTGTGVSQTIMNSGFQPDFVWTKSRSSASLFNNLMDSVRGINKLLYSNSSAAEETNALIYTAITSNGFTVGTDNSGNQSGQTFVGWQWKAGGTAVTNTSGSVSSQVSASTTSGFSVVTWTCPASGAGYTVGHGLGTTPAMIFIKERSAINDWYVWHKSLSNTAQGNLRLNEGSAEGTSAFIWNNTTPTSTVFSTYVGTTLSASGTGVAYCFAEVAGYNKISSYTGNASTTDGPFVFTGFRPAYVMIRRIDGSGDWIVWDSTRNTFNVTNSIFQPNNSGAEYTDATYAIDLLSNGFKLRNTTNTNVNASGGTYIYMAFASHPFKHSLAR